MWSRTHDLAACSKVPQPTTLPRALLVVGILSKYPSLYLPPAELNNGSPRETECCIVNTLLAAMGY
jgi:hypothetical protein